jgi:hypothetical protein
MLGEFLAQVLVLGLLALQKLLVSGSLGQLLLQNGYLILFDQYI